MTTPVRVRWATAADAHALSAFAAAVFDETFGPHNDPEDMAVYIGQSFSPDRQAAEIADAGSVMLVAEATDDGNAFAGYAHVVAGLAPPVVRARAPLELKRFYVAPMWHGRGVAGRLMDEVLQAAAARGADTLWLAVWERNPRAIAFYRKAGFVEVGTQRFTLGRDVQNDLVMARPLSAPR